MYQHSTQRKYFFNFGTLDYGPQNSFVYKYSLLVFFVSGQLEIVITWPAKYGGRAQRTHHLGRVRLG